MVTLSPQQLDRLTAPLDEPSRSFAMQYPGERSRRQPVHTVYGGAQLFRSDLPARLGAHALRALGEHAPDPDTFARAIGLPPSPDFNRRVYDRAVEKLRREPVEDFRIDFEDGFGNRPDPEEDEAAEGAARATAAAQSAGTLPPFFGIRIKPLNPELRARAMRTLDLYLTTLVESTGGRLPSNFVVTLPKITLPEQVELLASLLDALERGLGLAADSIGLELMIETPQSLVDAQGRLALPALIAAAHGRAVAAHFGTYDYTASLNITAAHQHMAHAACDFARHVLQVSLAGTGVWLSDGATNILPVPPHREAPGGPPLTPAQIDANRTAVHRAWKLHYGHIRHSLEHAYYQGWDLHPAQLPTRYAAVYAFFLEGLDPAAERLRIFVERAARATLVGDVFDDAATGQGLLNFFLRAIACGAIAESEATRLTGLTVEELRGRSFVKILERRL
jgi:citrate lyase beta subunit